MRILEAAREAFATLGYERATVRRIAEMAQIHPSMVMRYYASKESLFAASSQFSLQLPDFSKADRAKAGELIVQTFSWSLGTPRGSGRSSSLITVICDSSRRQRKSLIAVYTLQVKPALDRLIPAEAARGSPF